MAEQAQATASLDFVPGEKPGSKSAIPTTDTATSHSLLKQIEYYFSENNLPKDKFLQAEIAKDDDGWVDLTVIAGFNRIKQLLPSGSVEALAEALKASKQLAVSEDSTKVRRPDAGRKLVTLGGVAYRSREEVVSHARGLIAQGTTAEGGALPEEAQAFVKDILAHHENRAEKEGVGVASIKVGRNPLYPDTSCFVLVRTDGTEADFSYLKCLDRIYGTSRTPGRGGAPPGGGGGKRKRGADEGGSPSKTPRSESGADGADKESGDVQYEPGKIVCFQSLPEGFDRHTLREKLGGVDKGCSFVEMVPEMPLAYARFASAAQASAALSVEGVGESKLLEGEDERQYWEKIAAGSHERGKGGKGGKGGGKGKGKGKGGKGGRGRGRGGGRRR